MQATSFLIVILSSLHFSAAIICYRLEDTKDEIDIIDCPECTYCEYMVQPQNTYNTRGDRHQQSEPAIFLNAVPPADNDDYRQLMTGVESADFGYSVLSVCKFEKYGEDLLVDDVLVDNLMLRCVCDKDMCNTKSTFNRFLNGLAVMSGTPDRTNWTRERRAGKRSHG